MNSWRQWIPARGIRASAGIAGVLGVAMALNIALFSVVHGALFRPLPFPSADRIVHLEIPFERLLAQPQQFVTLPGVVARLPLSEPTFVRHRAGIDAAVIAYSVGDLRPVSVSPNFFELFGAFPAIGRVLDKADIASRPRPVLLSHALWMSRYGGTTEVLNQSVILPGPVGLPDERATIVGIMREGFEFPKGANVWMPYSSDESLPAPVPDYARLAPEASVSKIQEALPGVSVTPLRAYLRPREAWPLTLVLVNCVLLVLTGWIQAGGLTIGRATDRLKEFALRRALGSTDGQLRRMVASESAVFGAVIFAVSWGLSLPLSGILVATLPGEFSAGLDLSVGAQGFVFALALVLTGSLLLFAISSSAVRAAQATILIAPAGSTRTAAARRLQSTFFATQVALVTTLMLLAGASFKNLSDAQRIDLGFNPEGLVAFVLPMPPEVAAAEAVNRQLVRQSLQATRLVPGVRAASLAGAWPLADATTRRLIEIASSEPIEVRIEHVGVGYPATIGARLIEGREALREEASPSIAGGRISSVGLVNQAFGRRLAERGRAIGQVIALSAASTVRVVGVINDVEDRDFDGQAPPTIYMYRSDEVSGAVLLVRLTDENSLSSVRARLDDIWGVDRRSIAMVSLEDIASRLSAHARLRTQLMTLVTFICIPITMWGIAGMVSDEISRGRRELSIRLAIGASYEDLAGRFLKRLLTLAVGGILAGSVAGVWLVKFAGSIRSVVTIDSPLIALIGFSALAVVYFAAAIGLRSLRQLVPADLLRRAG